MTHCQSPDTAITEEYVYPEAYHAIRESYSYSNPAKRTKYHCVIRYIGTQASFEVSPADNMSDTIIGSTPDSVWIEVSTHTGDPSCPWL